MKVALLLIVIYCPVVAAQTPKSSPTPDPAQEAIRILQAQVERLERKNAEMQKQADALLKQEAAIRAERRAVESTAPVESYSDPDYYFPRYRYMPYRYRSSYLFYPTRRYYPRTYYPYHYPRHYPRYYPRAYISPFRTFRR